MYIPPEVLAMHNEHMVKAHELFGDTPVNVRNQSETKLLFVCFTNRCGSNYLSEAIASSSELNPAGECFNAKTMENKARTRSIKSFGGYMGFLARRAGINTRFCSKIAITQFAMLDKYNLFDQAGRDPRFIFIERRDLLGQAISWQIASQTQRWRSIDPGVTSVEDLRFSSKSIDWRMESIAQQNHLWRLAFAKNRIPFFHVIYEDFVAAPLETLARIAAWLDIGGAFELGKVQLRQQRSSLNDEWLSQYSPFA